MAAEWQVLEESWEHGILSQKLGQDGRYTWHIDVRDNGKTFRVMRYTGASYSLQDSIPTSLLTHIFRLMHRMKQILLLSRYREHSPFKQGSVLKIQGPSR